jgi:hypothetical protein
MLYIPICRHPRQFDRKREQHSQNLSGTIKNQQEQQEIAVTVNALLIKSLTERKMTNKVV